MKPSITLLALHLSILHATGVDSLRFSSNFRHWTSIFCTSASSGVSCSRDPRAAAAAAAFDFSSPTAWDAFYQEGSTIADSVTEWHASVSFDDQLALLPRTHSKCRILMVGCGNSRLPAFVARQAETSFDVTCLDSSRTCIEQLKHTYREVSNMHFVYGDAVELSRTLHENCAPYHVVFDKGLTDALMCGEGWNGPLERLLEEAYGKVTMDGIYILISYKLADSTREFIESVGGFEWTFDVKGSNDRVSVSIGRKMK